LEIFSKFKKFIKIYLYDDYVGEPESSEKSEVTLQLNLSEKNMELIQEMQTEGDHGVIKGLEHTVKKLECNFFDILSEQKIVKI
jgi:hypothetical protein